MENWFIETLNSENEPVLLLILTGIALLAARAAILTRKPLFAMIDGMIVCILFIALLLLVPDKEPWIYAGDVMKKIGIRPSAYLAPAAATACSFSSLIAFLSGRKKKEE